MATQLFSTASCNKESRRSLPEWPSTEQLPARVTHLFGCGHALKSLAWSCTNRSYSAKITKPPSRCRRTSYMTIKLTKHVDIKHHVIRYWCKEDVMDFAYVDTDNQLADIMTKILTMPAFRRHRAQCMSDMHVDDNNNHFNYS